MIFGMLFKWVFYCKQKRLPRQRKLSATVTRYKLFHTKYGILYHVNLQLVFLWNFICNFVIWRHAVWRIKTI